MNQFDLLATITEALEVAGIPHMVAGSFASTFHSAPRTTNDIDVVIDADPASIVYFLDRLDSDRFVVADALRAVRDRDMFNVIDAATGWKVDLIVRKDRPFSVSELSRRQRATVGGVEVWVATIEDTILSKLEWARESRSERQHLDVMTLLRHGQDLDDEYLDRWAVDLEVMVDLDELRQRAGES